MTYSDKDLMVSTQIAYYDVKKSSIKNDLTIADIIKDDRNNNCGTYNQVVEQMKKAEKEHGIDSLQYKRFKETLDMYNSIADLIGIQHMPFVI